VKVVSPAGDFEILIKEAEIEGNSVIIKGQMGVWDSKIYLSPGDLWLFASIFLRPSVLLFLLQLPFRLLFRRSRQNNKTD
jgi:hypothetical protein